MRTLASIQKIVDLSPIEGADRIEVATVLGWQIVVQKGLYEVGDLAVYFEIDSLLPMIPQFEFLRANCYVSEKSSSEGEGFRLKTIRLRKQVSQGLLMPLREIESLLPGHVSEGDDVTEAIGVKKYERPIAANLAGVARGNFPSFIPKTDENRIQNVHGRLRNRHNDLNWEVSLKLDGSSMTAYVKQTNAADFPDETTFGVCSRNLDLTETEGNSFWQVARRLELPQKMNLYRTRSLMGTLDEGLPQINSFAIQGELMGPGVQGNRENLSQLDLYVFNIWDIDKQKYLSSPDRLAITKALGLKDAPIYGTVRIDFEYLTVAQILELADTGYGGKSLNHPIREGVVYKCVEDPSISWKAISNRFLLKGGE